jgi:eukaryotic-like serine/threonine-protein kinase
MASKKFSRFLSHHSRSLWIAGGLLLTFVLMNYVVLPMYVNQSSRLAVPRVVGLTVEEARAALDSTRLVAVEGETKPDPSYPVGTVSFQNPLPGAVVKEGRRIYLTVSGGDVQVPVPLLRGKSVRDARFALERNGLKLGATTYDYSESFPENTIIDQSAAADSRIPKGAFVGVTVSKGRASQEIMIPSVVGKSLSEAESILKAAGLRVGIVTSQPSFELLPNTVVDQFPRAGEPAKVGQEIDLFVVRVGKPKEEIPQAKE